MSVNYIFTWALKSYSTIPIYLLHGCWLSAEELQNMNNSLTFWQSNDMMWQQVESYTVKSAHKWSENWVAISFDFSFLITDLRVHSLWNYLMRGKCFTKSLFIDSYLSPKCKYRPFHRFHSLSTEMFSFLWICIMAYYVRSESTLWIRLNKFIIIFHSLLFT